MMKESKISRNNAFASFIDLDIEESMESDSLLYSRTESKYVGAYYFLRDLMSPFNTVSLRNPILVI